MGTKGYNILFEEDEKDYLDDPISLLDFEEHKVFWGSENYLKNITIEDPGYVINNSLEDYEVQLERSLFQIKKLKKLRESALCASNNANLLSKCRSCSIKLVDCHKFPWYYDKLFGSINKTHYSNTDYQIIKVEEETNKEEIIIVDLSEKDNEKIDELYKNRIRYINNERLEVGKTNRNKLIGIDNLGDGKVRKGTNKRLSIPVINNTKKNHTKVPESGAQQAPDLIISTYTRIIDKAIQKLKNNIDFIPNNMSNKLLLDSNNFINSRDNLSQDTIYLEDSNLSVQKVSKDKNNNEYINNYNIKKNNKRCNKMKNMYTSEQIGNTKIKIKRNSLKSKNNTSIKKHFKEYDKNLNAIYIAQYKSYLKEKTHNNGKNKQKRIELNSLLLPCTDFPKTIIETNKSTLLPNQNISQDRSNVCNKKIFSANRIIPHFHGKTYLKHPDISINSNSNEKCSKRSDETINNYVTKKLKNCSVSTENFFIGDMDSQKSVLSIHQGASCIENIKTKDNLNEHNKNNNNNTKLDVSNITELNSDKRIEAISKLPIHSKNILNRLTHISPDVTMKNVNNIFFIRQSKIAAQLKEERTRYLLPSNCN